MPRGADDLGESHRRIVVPERGSRNHRGCAQGRRDPTSRRSHGLEINDLPGGEHIRLLRYQGPEQRSREGADAKGRIQHGASFSLRVGSYGTPTSSLYPIDSRNSGTALPPTGGSAAFASLQSEEPRTAMLLALHGVGAA